MKFKILFTVLNIVLFTAFLAVFFLPYLFVSPDYMSEFWQKNWFLGVLFLFAVILVNTLFLKNWHIMSCLEREDWPALAEYLEKQVFYLKKTGQRPVRLLYESLVLLGDFTSLEKLAALLKKEDPRRYFSMVRGFTGAAILAGDYGKVRAVCAELRAEQKLDEDTAGWVTFYHGLSRYLDGDAAGSVEDFSPLARDAGDPLLQAISAFLCSTVRKKMPDHAAPVPRDTLDKDIALARERITSAYGRKKWNRFLQRNEQLIEIVILGKLPRQASEWLFPSDVQAA